jgi:glucose-1-phosphate adenylyltransferase
MIPIEATYAQQFGIVGFDKDFRIREFMEKPLIKEKKRIVFASMGNYIFDTELLIKTLEENVQYTTTHDFGRDIIPLLVKKKVRVYAYDFSKNRIPSLKTHVYIILK